MSPDLTLAIIVLGASITQGTLFLYCIYGTLASECFHNMPDYLYNQLEWQKFPVNVQRHFIVIIANMQRKLHYHGFGLINLNLASFVTVTFHPFFPIRKLSI